MRAADHHLDHGVLSDPMIRAGIRRLCQQYLGERAQGGLLAELHRDDRLIAELARAPIACTSAGTAYRHLPSAFFELVLGPHRLAGCAYWPDQTAALGDAERAMLDLVANRAGLGDGQHILDMAGGWGAFTLYAAARYPASRVTGLVPTPAHREYVLAAARRRGLSNVEVATADINDFNAGARFDRIVVMSEALHVRNYTLLCERLARWLAHEGRAFVSVATHRRFTSICGPEGGMDWLPRPFLSGDLIPSEGLLTRAQHVFDCEAHWRIAGTHYRRTADAWLQNMDRHRESVDALLETTYGRGHVTRWRARWRAVFMACAEMFGHRQGQEWFMSQYRFRPRVSDRG